MTDTTFQNYGGNQGTSTALARTAAYFIAEKEMSSHLNTLLLPMDIVESHNWNAGNPFQMDWGNINSVSGIMVQSNLNTTFVYSAGDMARAVFIRNAKSGQLDIQSWPLMFQISSPGYPLATISPYSVQVSYNAGMPSGTSLQPDMLWCLTMATQLVLNEMSTDGFLSNEAPGGIGVQQFANELYSEKRTPLGISIFGQSPIAQQISRLVASYSCRAVGRFRR